MSEQFLLSSDGICMSCNEQPSQAEIIKCFVCKLTLHAICGVDNEKIATKSLINCFNRPSTRSNFQFFCDPGITQLEIINVENEESRVSILEENIRSMNSDLAEIKKLLKKQFSNSTVASHVTSLSKQSKKDGSIWFNREKLASVKAPPSVLVVNKPHETIAEFE